MPVSVVNTTTNYQRGTYPFPKDEISVDDKNAEWCRQWCEAIYAVYVTDRSSTPYSNKEEWANLRRYGGGNQRVDKYQEILVGEEEADGELKGYLNINWDIFSVMPKFKHIVRGIFEEQEHAIVATAIDPKSIETKDTEKLKKWFKSRYKDLIGNVQQMAGVQQEPEWLPESIDELEIYQSVGGFKMAKETEIEEALDYTLYISDWKENKRKMIDDFADINCAAVKDFTDPYTRKVKIRYVDPLQLIIQYSRHWDHRNSEYAGEIIQESISNIRKNTDLTEEQLRNLAQFYNGRFSNKNLSSWAESDLILQEGGWRYDDFMVEIMDAEWFSINEKGITKRTNSRGQTFSYEEKTGKMYNDKKRRTELKRYKVVYRAKWIIGMDYVYDFGLQYDVTRPGKKEVELSFKFYKLPGRSLVSLAVPNLDQMQLTWLKLQNAIAMSSNSGIAVEFSSLMNMKLGGDKMEPMDILSIRRDTGDLIYKLTNAKGHRNGGQSPIQELKGGIGSQLEEFLRLFELNLNFIRDLTGINRITDASNPNPNDSVGGSEMAIAATSNALKPIYSAYIRLKELAARSAALRIQLLLRHDKKAYEGYIPVVGGSGVKILSVGTEAMDADYNITITAKPTSQRKQMIMQAAMQAMQPDKSGNSAIEQADYMMIERLVEAGNEKLAEITLNYKSKKNKQHQLQVQRENMEIDSKNQQQAATVKGEQERKSLQFKSQLKIKEEQSKYDLEDRNSQRDHERDMQKIAAQTVLDAQMESNKVEQPNKQTA
jgi:hypothetical protein